MPDEIHTLKNLTDKLLKSWKPGVAFRKRHGDAYGHTGDPDYDVCLWGRYGIIEIKHPIKKPKLGVAQGFRGKALQAAGAILIEAYSVEEIKRAVLPYAPPGWTP